MLASSDESRESLSGKWFLRATVEASKQENLTFFQLRPPYFEHVQCFLKTNYYENFFCSSIYCFDVLYNDNMDTQKKNPIGWPGLSQISKKILPKLRTTARNFP
jgi:hypothetical protein